MRKDRNNWFRSKWKYFERRKENLKKMTS